MLDIKNLIEYLEKAGRQSAINDLQEAISDGDQLESELATIMDAMTPQQHLQMTQEILMIAGAWEQKDDIIAQAACRLLSLAYGQATLSHAARQLRQELIKDGVITDGEKQSDLGD